MANLLSTTLLTLASQYDNTHECYVERLRKETEAKTRPCLKCGTLHAHNNAYCSAECCKADKYNLCIDEGCPQHGTEHVCKGEVYTPEYMKLKGSVKK